MFRGESGAPSKQKNHASSFTMDRLLLLNSQWLTMTLHLYLYIRYMPVVCRAEVVMAQPPCLSNEGKRILKRCRCSEEDAQKKKVLSPWRCGITKLNRRTKQAFTPARVPSNPRHTPLLRKGHPALVCLPEVVPCVRAHAVSQESQKHPYTGDD